MIIYKITNKINSKIYIGQTIGTLSNRWNSHCKNKKFSLITAAINKYGKENFTIEEIAKCSSREELNMREAMFIYAFGSNNRDTGYNIMEGGDNHTTHSTETRAIISKKARNISDETRKKMSEAKKGKKQTPEQIAARIKTGRVWSEESKRKSSEKQKGRKKSPEQVEKVRKKLIGRKQTPEEIEKRRLSNIGRKATLEQKEKYRQAALKREAKKREKRGI
jgi:group I intron endonuclease